MSRTCACGVQIGPKNKSGKCRTCFNRDLNNNPAMRARQAAGRAAYFARPEVRNAYAARLAAHMANMSDAERERRREWGRRVYREVLSKPEVIGRSLSPESRARAGRARTETTLGWCPPELRDAYRALLRKGVSAADARAAIELEIPGTVAHARRAVANARDAQRIRHEREKAQAY